MYTPSLVVCALYQYLLGVLRIVYNSWSISLLFNCFENGDTAIDTRLESPTHVPSWLEARNLKLDLLFGIRANIK